MAGCQERTRLWFGFLVCFLLIGLSRCSSYNVLFRDLPTNVLQRQIKVSRHQPFCVVFRKTGAGSKLEKTVHGLWQDKQSPHNYTSWQVGSFDVEKSKLPPKNEKPAHLPAVRCYLGETSTYDFSGKVSKSIVGEWLDKLSDVYTEQSVDVSSDVLLEAQKNHHIVLLAFPDGPRHHEIEDMIYGLASEINSCKALAVHLHSPHVRSLRQKYKVNKYPSVVVIHSHWIASNDSSELDEEWKVFSGQHITNHVLNVYIHARTIEAPLLDMERFASLVTATPSPVMVCFYGHWAPGVLGYLTAFNMTMTQYQADNVELAYGLVDITLDTSKKLISRYLKSGAMKSVPFLAIYKQENNEPSLVSVVHVGRPYPWVMYPTLHKIQPSIDVIDYPPPWGTVKSHQLSSIQEGPNGTLCTPWSSNMTDNTPVHPRVVVKRRRIIVKKPAPPVPQKSWHDVMDTDRIDEQLTVHEGIPLLTGDMWTDVIEKSHAPKHIFYKSGAWAGEVTKVSLVIYIMADCGNCRRNNQTFRQIKEAVSHIDGGAMYYVNCTAEPVLCRDHTVRGFPTITAYRGLGWMGNSSCVSQKSHTRFRKYVRLDYHGIIRPKPILDWFSNAADNAVINRKWDKMTDNFETKDVRLVATLVPKHSAYSESLSESGTPFSYTCLRLLCERLYSIVACHSVYSTAVDNSDYNTLDVELIVTQLRLERSDGIQSVLMTLGTSLWETLEGQSDTQIHAYHKQHSYQILKDQLCEDNLSVCTDIIIEFILDHSRLPITPLTSDMFHTSTSLLKEEDLPILIVMVHPENITRSAQFLQELTAAAYEVYNSIIVMTLDTNKYSVWATKFVPALYGHMRVFESDEPDPLSMYMYPRLCIVQKSDHKHAAMYPPITRQRHQHEDFTTEIILDFVNQYLTDPQSLIVETEHF